ncbi:GH36-type glycosyl hydrolase domain-containing protein [Mucisphaera sp.]|uniref:GH36-type glycosyl hydrolase domain-containing protein n=1 Tax=Mucisphaera sp. TaxID=2913024 RepID=UPI003D122B52
MKPTMPPATHTGTVPAPTARPQADRHSDALIQQAKRFIAAANRIELDADDANHQRFHDTTYRIDETHVLEFPRERGDSRYALGREGFNLWLYASGQVHANKGLFSYFLKPAEGGEPFAACFLGLLNKDGSPRQTVRLLPLEPEPGPQVRQFAVLAPEAAWYITRIAGICAVVRVSLSPDEEMRWSTAVWNETDDDHEVVLSTYLNPFLRHGLHPSSEDVWFRRGEIITDEEGSRHVLIRVNEDIDRETSVVNHGVIGRTIEASRGAALLSESLTTSRLNYLGGSQHSARSPRSVSTGSLDQTAAITEFTDTAVSADLLKLALPSGSLIRQETTLNVAQNDTQPERWLKHRLSPVEADRQLEQSRAAEAARHDTLGLTTQGFEASFGDEVFAAFFEHLKRQVDVCAELRGYMQVSASSLIGVRDVCQAIEAQLLWRPQAARSKLLEVLAYTGPDGRCLRQYALPDKAGRPGRVDSRPFIDQGVWVISTLATYLRATGDRQILSELVGYHRLVESDPPYAVKTDAVDTVLDHLIRIAEYLLDHRDPNTGCLRAMYGDWNDAIDGLGLTDEPGQAYGNGVSVMATLQLYQNCLEMEELLALGDHPQSDQHRSRYRQATGQLAAALRQHAITTADDRSRRILHGWGHNQHYEVGGFCDLDGQARDGLAANAMWVLSGMAQRDPTFNDDILRAFDRLDGPFGLKTFAPGFGRDTRQAGRIGNLPLGTAENGACYVHATAFGIMALFRLGQPRRAWQQLLKILPFAMPERHVSHSPFVMPNSYSLIDEAGAFGESMNDWQTGSSNVVLKTLVHDAAGIQPAHDGIWVNPATWAPCSEIRLHLLLRDRPIELVWRRGSGTARTFIVNGRVQTGEPHPLTGVRRLWLPYDQLKTTTNTICVLDDPQNDIEKLLAH